MRTGLAMVVLLPVLAGCGGTDRPGVVGSDPSAVTYAQVQDAIFTPSCAVTGCHVAGSAPFGLDLSTGQSMANIVGVPSAEVPEYERIDPFNPADSYLYMKVTGDPRILGDQMPALAPPLSGPKIRLLEDWIEQGANP